MCQWKQSSVSLFKLLFHAKESCSWVIAFFLDPGTCNGAGRGSYLKSKLMNWIISTEDCFQGGSRTFCSEYPRRRSSPIRHKEISLIRMPWSSKKQGSSDDSLLAGTLSVFLVRTLVISSLNSVGWGWHGKDSFYQKLSKILKLVVWLWCFSNNEV